MFREYNPNPSNKRVGDCVDLTIQAYLMSDFLSSNAVWGAYLKSKGFSRDVISADCPDCYTVRDFCREHPCGVYVIGTGSHAVCVVDGILYDTWDSSDETPIYFYYKGE